jgi:nucleoside-diphosphate-sugar epimerase
MPAPPSILIAGCGYLGSALARMALSRGLRILGVSRSETSAQALRDAGISARAADLSDAAAVAALAKELSGETSVVHCATGGRGGTADTYRAVYLEGMRYLRAAFPGAPRLIFTSSTSVYAQTDGSRVNEDSPANPDRGTGRILRETEDETLAAGGTVVRLAGLYGPGRSVLLRDFLTGKSGIDVRPVDPATPDGRWINQIHRDDAARSLLFLLTEADQAAVRSRIFNAADSTPMLQRELYQELARRFSRPLPPEGPPDASRKRGWTHKRVDASRLRALGWQPQFPSWFDALDHDAELVPSIMAQLS